MALEISWIYPIIFDDKTLSSTSYVDLANVTYCVLDFSAMEVAEVKIYVDINGSTDARTIRAYDEFTQEEIGSVTDSSTGGIASFTFTKPSNDCLIKIQAKKDTDLSTDPIIRAGFIRYAPSTN